MAGLVSWVFLGSGFPKDLCCGEADCIKEIISLTSLSLTREYELISKVKCGSQSSDGTCHPCPS